ncbi:MAG: alanine racemase [Granulosicoccus sp.]|nr:alanine racemase [Granulosicoccus sp.]
MTRDFTATGELPQQIDPHYRRSVSVSVNLDALRHNLATARSLCGSKLFATIKADAYGHGAVPVARAMTAEYSDTPTVEANGQLRDPPRAFADGFAVVTLEEALELRQSGIRQPILVLQGPQQPDAAEQMQRERLWPVIHDHHQYAWYSRLATRRTLGAWLKVDTGMGRLGFQPTEAIRILRTDDAINWTGVMTHFACADEPENPFTDHQLAVFNAIHPTNALQRSLANSAAILAWPRTRADWARPGIMLYGCNPLNRALPPEVELKPVMSVHAPLISAKKLLKGAGVGYAQTWICPQDMPVGYAAVGYRDGVPRVLDSSATVLVRGKRCPVVGRVSMDSIAIDLRAVPDAQPGERVELWGEQLPVDDLARAAGTISYELLTSIRGRRIYTEC